MISPVFINMRFEYVMKLTYAGWGLPVSIIFYPTTLFLFLYNLDLANNLLL